MKLCRGLPYPRLLCSLVKQALVKLVISEGLLSSKARLLYKELCWVYDILCESGRQMYLPFVFIRKTLILANSDTKL